MIESDFFSALLFRFEESSTFWVVRIGTQPSRYADSPVLLHRVVASRHPSPQLAWRWHHFYLLLQA